MQARPSSKKPHYRLDAWKQSMVLVRVVYDATKTFPPEELYGLTSQIRRSAVSIPSNVAEGAARSSAREFAHYLSIAKGSLSELETQLLIGKDLGYLKSDETVFDLLEQVSRLISGLHKKVAS